MNAFINKFLLSVGSLAFYLGKLFQRNGQLEESLASLHSSDIQQIALIV